MKQRPPTQAEIEITRQVLALLRERGYEIVSRELIGRISDYFHVNTQPSDDLAQSYVNALDAIILRDHTTPVAPTRCCQPHNRSRGDHE